jgi:glycerophosphoryl diester phosphodiesterase
VTPPPRGSLPGWVVEVPLAHRGLHGPGVPENSLAAFAAARDAGVGVELDVHVTADAVPIVLHDPDLARVAGVELDVRRVPLGAVREHALADGSSVPTLVEALDEIGDAPVMVEVKNAARGAGVVEPPTALVLDELVGRRLLVASFHPGSLRWFRLHRPSVLRAQTIGLPTASRVPATVAGPVASLVAVGRAAPHVLSCSVTGLAHSAVRRWREEGGLVDAWTVRTRDELADARAGADNVIFEALPASAVLAAGDGPRP